MQTVLDANLGSVEIHCPWCVHEYPFMTDLIVAESKVPEIYYKVKSAYERILYLQNYNAKHIEEITRLEHQLIMDRGIFASKVAAAKAKAPKCAGLEVAANGFTSCCAAEDACHCPH
jgi:hypothetical protein